jgi:midasin
VHFQESERNWLTFERDVLQFEAQYVTKQGKFAFGFIEGPLVRALRSGDWYVIHVLAIVERLTSRRILLDEINLASQETLEAVSAVLRDPLSSVTLTENDSMEPIPRHPNFRIFACMNPATDAGKKEIPPNIRSYFTEIEVPPPDADRDTLLAIISQYIGPSAVSDKAAIMDIAEFYTAVKALSADRRIADGSNRPPYFSMRTLARALTFAAETASAYSLRRALWEGCLMAFTMTLDVPSAELVTSLAKKYILSGVRNIHLFLTREPAPPQSQGDFIKFGPFYLEKGDMAEFPIDDYIITPSVERKLVDLARIISTRMFPVLIEGPTSSGKTSTVEFLAKRTGHRFVRINNHEHTDIQEYLGTYVSDPISGKLVFKDGLLVQALRQGDWIVLDELNLAPTDVLEALNRLLDDNRELFIPETQEVIKPHPHFMLFATQNPPGLYAGRKLLSRAFRSRFLEVHFEDVPQAELETILCQRCRIAPSYARCIVAVFRELQKRRQTNRVFESKQGFATLRDLFRWAGRDAVGYQDLAENGYMLLGERARREDDKGVVKSVIESIMKIRIDEATLYSFDRFRDDMTGFLGFHIPLSSNIFWTGAMQKLLVLVGRALRSNEPVLLVGETGSGKTSVCQVYAGAVNKRLLALNCHQNTEAADLIGGLRPIRNKAALEAEAFAEASSLLLQYGISGISNDTTSLLSAIDQLEKSQLVGQSKVEEVRRKLQRTNGIFEWHDGPLVEAMKGGDVFLLDEISLADDSVLERLNSVLEPARTIVLAEKGGDSAEGSLVRAKSGFQLIATMNPGGDYGKKELSPALRNRFTEIWVPPVNERVDLVQIINCSWRHDSLQPYTDLVLDFIEWLGGRVSEPSLLGLRDVIVSFRMDTNLKFLH